MHEASTRSVCEGGGGGGGEASETPNSMRPLQGVCVRGEGGGK